MVTRKISGRLDTCQAGQGVGRTRQRIKGTSDCRIPRLTGPLTYSFESHTVARPLAPAPKSLRPITSTPFSVTPTPPPSPSAYRDPSPPPLPPHFAALPSTLNPFPSPPYAHNLPTTLPSNHGAQKIRRVEEGGRQQGQGHPFHLR